MRTERGGDGGPVRLLAADAQPPLVGHQAEGMGCRATTREPFGERAFPGPEDPEWVLCPGRGSRVVGPDEQALVARRAKGRGEVGGGDASVGQDVAARGCADGVELAGLLPEQPFVLDHLAKPRIALGPAAPEFASWRRDVEALARHRNVSCKLSGLVTEAAWGAWRREDFTPYLDVALAAFGPDRLMMGSDWPVCLLSGTYADVAGIVADFIAPLAGAEREAILGGTATRFYGLD